MRFASSLGVLSLLLLLSIGSILGQEDAKDSEENKCAVSSGWSYAAGSSGGYSYSSSSSSYSTNAVIGMCNDATLPSDCIKANYQCQWCAQEDFTKKRCNIKKELISQNCSRIELVESSAVSTEFSGGQRFSVESATVEIRIGETVFVDFKVKEPEVYPVDLYYLMDLSNSMKDDLANVNKLATEIVETLQQLTKGEDGSVRLGFGTFVDKVQSPMTQMTSYKLMHPYGNDTEPPFLYENKIELTSNISRFQEVVSAVRVSGNLDPPEAALDAMLQVAKCKELIGWSPDALRLMLVATESAYHYGGDGMGIMAGFTRANDGECHTGSSGKYEDDGMQDYPTVNQVVRAIEDSSITPVFAIGANYEKMYQYVSNNVFRGSTYGVLNNDSSNVVELVRDAYLSVSGQQEVLTANPDEEALCIWYNVTKPLSAQALELDTDGTFIEGLASGSKVAYRMMINAHLDSCEGKVSCAAGDINVKTRKYDQKIPVHTTILSAFGCAANVIVNSPKCSGVGNFSCGICFCLSGFTGIACEESTIPEGCFAPGATLQCSGRGACLNDLKCNCEPGYKYNKASITGKFCECDTCPLTAGLVCSGHGNATSIGECSCECSCLEGWTGEDCSCANTTETCTSPTGAVCSGNGECFCGGCVCDATFAGPYCGECVPGPDKVCPSCEKFQHCVQCTMHGTGAFGQNCSSECSKYMVQTEKVNSMNDDQTLKDDGLTLCSKVDKQDDCKFYYAFATVGENYVIKAEEEKRCKSTYSLLIILWCILIFLLIGLILLCCWRCCVYVIDKEKEKTFLQENIFMPALIPLVPTIGAGSVIEFIKAKYLMRKSAKVAVIPIRRSFTHGDTRLQWRTYSGSAEDNDFEVLSHGEEGTMMRKRIRSQESNADSEPLLEESKQRGAGAQADVGVTRGGVAYEVLDETELRNGFPNGATQDYGMGEVYFKDGEEYANIEIPLTNDFDGKEDAFWVELYNQERGVALGLKRTKVIVIKDEDHGVIGFPKPSYVYKENDGSAVIPIHRTVGMDGPVSVAWSTRDISAMSGKHYVGGRGVLHFADGQVTQSIEVELINDLLYDETEKAFNLELDDAKGGATLDLAHCMVTLLSDDECPIVQFPKEAYPFMENCGEAEVSVLRTRSTRGISTVKWYTEDDTAIAGKDYVASSGLLTFEDASTEAHIFVPIIDNDEYVTTGRSFRVILIDPSEGTKLNSNNIVNISIIEDDEPGVFEFAKPVCIMRSNKTLGRLTIIRSLGSDGEVIIPWILAQDNSNIGQLPEGLLQLRGDMVFANNEISKSLDLDLADYEVKDDISFMCCMLPPSGGAKLGVKSKAVVRVFAEEDLGTVAFAQSNFDVMASQGVVTLLISRSGSSEHAAFVICETSDGTAVSGLHYRGGKMSVVFDAGEVTKELQVAIYNDPNHAGQLAFNATLHTSPGGPKIGDIGRAQVTMTCVPTVPVIHAGLAADSTGPCTVEFAKGKYIARRSAKNLRIPVHRSSTDGACTVTWKCELDEELDQIIKTEEDVLKNRKSLISMTSLSTACSSLPSSDDEDEVLTGKIIFEDGVSTAEIELPLRAKRASTTPQNEAMVYLSDLKWNEDDSKDPDNLRLGLKQTQVVILNDIDAGTLGFSKATYSVKQNEGTITIPVHRLGGMDGKVTTKWRTTEGSALEGRDYGGGHGMLTFLHNQVQQNIELKLKEANRDDGGERRFNIELYRIRGGAKSGLRLATVYILADEDRSVIQFSKSSYPVIGNATTVKIPLLRTGSCQKKAVAQWRTVEGTALPGVDYTARQDYVIFEPGMTRAAIDVELSGKAQKAKEFDIQLVTDYDRADESAPKDEKLGKAILGPNKSATVSIVSAREPGQFEFSKPSFVFRTNNPIGLVPVIRSGGTDGEMSVPWRIESLDKPSPFAGAEGILKFDDGDVTKNIEITLEGVPSDEFVMVLLPSDDGCLVLGPSTRATVTILGEQEEPMIVMRRPTLQLMGAEIVEITVLRHGDVNDVTYVGWESDDGTAKSGTHFIGGAGNMVFDPYETKKKILIPILELSDSEAVSFVVRLTHVRGIGKLGESNTTEVILEPLARIQLEHQQHALPPPTDIEVEFIRKRYLFRQSQPAGRIPVRRSNPEGAITVHYQSINMHPLFADNYSPITRARLDTTTSTGFGGDDDDSIFQQSSAPDSSSLADDDDEIDWGSGTVTFEDGQDESEIEIVLRRDMPLREMSFKLELLEPYDDQITLGLLPTTLVTVIRDKDSGVIGFPSSRYQYKVTTDMIVIPVQRTSGADGTVSVSWHTQDATAVGGKHYLPGEGNLLFGDGEVRKEIHLPMPVRVEFFEEDECAFKLHLSSPTGGAALNVNETKVVLENDLTRGELSFFSDSTSFKQSAASIRLPVMRSKDSSGIVTAFWQVRGMPGKPRSRYEGTNGTIVFQDAEDTKEITLKLPAQVQNITTDHMVVVIDPPSGRATLGEFPKCAVVIENDVSPGYFCLEKDEYKFPQSAVKGHIKVLRTDGSKGCVSLPWRILPADSIMDGSTSSFSPLVGRHGAVEFEDGQEIGDIEIKFPEDTADESEEVVIILLPPDGRADLEDPYRARITVDNDLKCSVGFSNDVYTISGDIDSFLLPLTRDGPKYRPITVSYKTEDGSAIDCKNYIGGEGEVEFGPGETKKDILIPVMNDTAGGVVTFTCQLEEVVTGGPGEIGIINHSTVNIENIAGAGRVDMATPSVKVKQSSGLAMIGVVRRDGKKGEAEVPWFVEVVRAQSSSKKTMGEDDYYNKLEGKLLFADGETDKIIDITLNEKPQESDETIFDVTLMTPVSKSGVLLGDSPTTRVTVDNDIDAGIIETEHDQVEVFGTNKQVSIPIIRSGNSKYPTQVTWEAEDDTAIRGKHYRAWKGIVDFPPGENRAEIIIPIENDPSGEVMYFNVTLMEAQNGAKIGPSKSTQVMIDHVEEMQREILVQRPFSPSTAVAGEISFADVKIEVIQSVGDVIVTLLRSGDSKGRVVVPWNISNAVEDSPYKKLFGQETFKEGEEESHIKIELVEEPQNNQLETFTIALGKPTGDFALVEDRSECEVSIINDILPGKVGFNEDRMVVKQSVEELVVPVHRRLNTEKKVRVQWRTRARAGKESIFANLSGFETFSCGEEVSHIKIEIDQKPQEKVDENFVIVLTEPKNIFATLDDIHECDVTVQNDIASAVIDFKDGEIEAKQSDGKLKLKLLRTHQPQGVVHVPWRIIPESNDSVYYDVTGDVFFEDDQDEQEIELVLPELPLPNPTEKMRVVLEAPVKSAAILGPNNSCNVTLHHDLGEGVVEMMTNEVTCSSDDGEAVVFLTRTQGSAFPTEVDWVAENDDALLGVHYDANKGCC